VQRKKKIKKSDMVTVLSGKDKGKRGKVLVVTPEKDRVIVEKINLIKIHSRPSSISRQGGIVEKEGPIAISKVQLVCPKCDKRTRVKIEVMDDGKLIRACRKCNEFIDKT
jgi:large subunit ribosomal protein L24